MPGPRGKRGRKILAPRSELERELAELWVEVLEIDQLSINDDVFAHGADLLTATQIRARLRVRFGVDCSLKDIFEAPTVAALAVRLRSLKKEAVFAPNLRGGAALGTPRPLSLHQHRFYVLHKLDRVGYDNQVMAAVRLIGPLNTDILEGSITKICERHEVLRSTFFERSGVPMQKVGQLAPV